MSQEELVAAARDGDQQAFEELVRQTYAATYTLAFRLTGNEEDARDVVQETYLRAWKAIRRFRGDAQFSTWLYRITANTSSSMTQRRSRNRADSLDDQGPEVVDERPFANPEASSEASALHQRLSEAVAELPPKLRTIVVLKDVYDLPHEAIAEELGISVAAAKVRLHRARKRLRDVLFEEREVLLVRCEDVAMILPRAVDVGEPVDDAVQTHVNSCLVCQAELARYHKLLKALRTMRTQLVMPAPGTLAMTLAALQEAQERRAIRSLVTGRRGAYIGAIGGAAVAAGAAAAAVALARRRAPRLAG